MKKVLLGLLFCFWVLPSSSEMSVIRPWPTLQELDGSPSVRYPLIKVPNGSLTDGATFATLTFGSGGGGGGASSLEVIAGEVQTSSPTATIIFAGPFKGFNSATSSSTIQIDSMTANGVIIISSLTATYLSKSDAATLYATVATLQSTSTDVTAFKSAVAVDSAAKYNELKATAADVSANYLTKSSATSTYLQNSSATSTYLQLSSAAGTYLQLSSAPATYLSKTDAVNTYGTIAQVRNVANSTGISTNGGVLVSTIIFAGAGQTNSVVGGTITVTITGGAGGAGGYAVEPATVTYQLNQGIKVSSTNAVIPVFRISTGAATPMLEVTNTSTTIVFPVITNKTRIITTTTTLTAADMGSVIFASAVANGFSIYCPTASQVTGQSFTVVIATFSSKLVTLSSGSTADLIDGQPTRIMWAGESATLLSNVLAHTSGNAWTKTGGKTIPMFCAMSRRTAQSIPNITVTKIPLDTVDTDNTGRMTDTSNTSSSGTFVAQRGGSYSFSWAASYGSMIAVSANTQGLLCLNNSGLVTISAPIAYAASAGYVSAGGSLLSYPVTLGDRFALAGYQSAGGIQSLFASVLYTFMSMTEVPTW